jgi:hypothetical protein
VREEDAGERKAGAHSTTGRKRRRKNSPWFITAVPNTRQRRLLQKKKMRIAIQNKLKPKIFPGAWDCSNLLGKGLFTLK